jgi:hypothetical protein
VNVDCLDQRRRKLLDKEPLQEVLADGSERSYSDADEVLGHRNSGLLLRNFADFRQAQIATSTDCARGTVRSCSVG